MSVSTKRMVLVLACSLSLLAGCTPRQPAQPSEPATPTRPAEQEPPKPPTVVFADRPSGAAFIESLVDQRGEVEVTDEMRSRFNTFAQDYRMVHLPEMDGYESLFDKTGAGGLYGYTNFADAVFYVLQYMRCPEAMGKDEMEDAVEKLFAAKEGYRQMPHASYRKFAVYENGCYSPWPEGGMDHRRVFYLLTGIAIDEGAGGTLHLTVRSSAYYFEDTTVFEAGPAEKWLGDRARSLKVADLEAAAMLVGSGEIDELQPRCRYETKIRVQPGGQRGLSPQFLTHHPITAAEEGPP